MFSGVPPKGGASIGKTNNLLCTPADEDDGTSAVNVSAIIGQLALVLLLVDCSSRYVDVTCVDGLLCQPDLV